MLKEYVSSGKWLEDFAAMSAAIGCDRTRLHHRIGYRRIDRNKVIMETRKHLAAEKKRQNTHNCAQSVVCTYCDLVGLDWIRVTRDRSPTREGSKQDDTTWNLFSMRRRFAGGPRDSLVPACRTLGRSMG